jgi:hypothetical protein
MSISPLQLKKMLILTDHKPDQTNSEKNVNIVRRSNTFLRIQTLKLRVCEYK